MKNKTFYVLKKEVLSIIKDRKTLLIMLLTPLLVPFVILLYGWLGDTIDNTEKQHTIGINYELSDYEKELLDELHLEPVVYNTLGELSAGYENDEYLAYIFKDEKGKYTIYSNEGSTDGMMASGYAQSYLQSYNQYLGNLKLIGEDLDPEEIYGDIEFETVKLSETSYMDNMMFSMATTYIIMIICITASTVTTDSSTGKDIYHINPAIVAISNTTIIQKAINHLFALIVSSRRSSVARVSFSIIITSNL